MRQNLHPATLAPGLRRTVPAESSVAETGLDEPLGNRDPELSAARLTSGDALARSD
jgi:hypothetical protein